MTEIRAKKKKLASILGQVRVVEGKKRFIPNSPDHLQVQVNNLPMGKVIALSFEEYKASRSSQQLAYHFVLMGYVSDYTGYTKEECHDTIMRVKFGTKNVKIGRYTAEIRKSISDSARFPKADMVDLITFDLQVCGELGIVVPTMEELGFISNK